MSAPADFCAMILTHGRPDRVHTFNALRKGGYTGPIFLVVDDLDRTRQQYVERYGANRVVVFDKRAVAATFDQGDNFQDYRAIIYARNATFQIARELGYRYFIQLDDDYKYFTWRFDRSFRYIPRTPRIETELNPIFSALLRFYVDSGAHSLAIAQGGDFIGGSHSRLAKRVQLMRKCMNSFICSVDRPFQFVGRVNEDVNTYTRQASTGLLMLTTNQVALCQLPTQTNAGGMSELYLDSGTYVKSFYSVMYHPSSVRVDVLRGQKNARIHHKVDWETTAPKIVPESVRK